MLGGKDAVFQERMKIYNEKEEARGGLGVVDVESTEQPQTEQKKDEGDKLIDVLAQERERIEQELTEKKREIVKKKEFLLEREPMGYRVLIKRIDLEIEKLEMQLMDDLATLNEKFSKKSSEEVVIPLRDEKKESYEDKQHHEFFEYLEKKNLLWVTDKPLSNTSSLKQDKAETSNNSIVSDTQPSVEVIE